MKDATLTLLLALSSFAGTAQDKLIFTNRNNGHRYIFKEGVTAKFELKSDTLFYNDWNVERCTDTSIVVSHWFYPRLGDSVIVQGTMLKKEVKFRDLEFISFTDQGFPRMFWGGLGLAGAVAVFTSYSTAKDDSTGEFDETAFHGMLIGGASASVIGALFCHHLKKKEMTLDMKEWEVRRKRSRQ
jgi:hypothetical protein